MILRILFYSLLIHKAPWVALGLMACVIATEENEKQKLLKEKA